MSGDRSLILLLSEKIVLIIINQQLMKTSLKLEN